MSGTLGRLPGGTAVMKEPRWLGPLRGHHHITKKMRAPMASPPEAPPSLHNAGMPSEQAREGEEGSPPCEERGKLPVRAAPPRPDMTGAAVGKKNEGHSPPARFRVARSAPTRCVIL